MSQIFYLGGLSPNVHLITLFDTDYVWCILFFKIQNKYYLLISM
jgi:hypothetical protein